MYGIASETEKRLSMILFSAIFDSLGRKAYDPDLFGRALPCLTAIGSALSPDYTLTGTQDEDENAESHVDGEAWRPRPVEVGAVSLSPDLGRFGPHCVRPSFLLFFSGVAGGRGGGL